MWSTVRLSGRALFRGLQLVQVTPVGPGDHTRCTDWASLLASSGWCFEAPTSLCGGQVMWGFSHGSKQQGIFTANFPEKVVDNLPTNLSTGIYYGLARVGSGDVHKMVVSIGWNPYCKNTKKAMETHIIHTFEEDFYGEMLNVAIVGYLRPEKKFESLESLISAIQGDIEKAKK